MGPFDREVRNGIDEMFDWDHDGMISPNEEANIYQFYEDVSGDSDWNDDDEDDDSDLDDEDRDGSGTAGRDSWTDL